MSVDKTPKSFFTFIFKSFVFCSPKENIFLKPNNQKNLRLHF
nr:MAG TPA: hypothetical protein [Caudoviricetes sp.]